MSTERHKKIKTKQSYLLSYLLSIDIKQKLGKSFKQGRTGNRNRPWHFSSQPAHFFLHGASFWTQMRSGEDRKNKRLKRPRTVPAGCGIQPQSLTRATPHTPGWNKPRWSRSPLCVKAEKSRKSGGSSRTGSELIIIKLHPSFPYLA